MYIGMFVFAQFWDMYYQWDAVKGYIGGWLDNTDRMFRVVEVRGQYVKVERMGYSRTLESKWYNAKRITPVPADKMEHAMNLYRRSIEAKSAQDIADADAKRRKDVQALSQNTVTRALVHAADNGYCNETVVALVSAGHKMPEGTLTFKVSIEIPIELDGKEDYYIMRDIFGATRGDLSKLVTSDYNSYNSDQRLTQRIEDKLSNIGARLDWQDTAPRITAQDIEFPMPSIRPIEDVQTAPAAYGGSEY